MHLGCSEAFLSKVCWNTMQQVSKVPILLTALSLIAGLWDL